MSRVPVGRLTLVAALAVGGWLLTQAAPRPRFRVLRPGMEFATIRGDPYCRRGSTGIAVLRVDPARARLRVHHYTRWSRHELPTIVEWLRRTDAHAVFNAGQYYPDYSYMGLLISGGRPVSSRAHPTYRAALVARPGAARVLDLDAQRLDAETSGWSEVAQSFMLFDRAGRLRIRKSAQIANRTAVAEDKSGRLVVITTEGGYTLHEFAELLKASPLQLSHAMAMDGGFEAELCVDAGSFRYASFGRWNGGSEGLDAPGAMVPLPAVITVTGE